MNAGAGAAPAPPAGAAAAPQVVPALPAAPNITTITGVQFRPPLADVANRPVVDDDLEQARLWRAGLTIQSDNGQLVNAPISLALADAYITKLNCLHGTPIVSLADVMTAITDLGNVVTANHAEARRNHTEVTNRLDNFSQEVRKYGRLAAITYNRSCGDGTMQPFAVVCSVAGVDPTARPHPNLPPIRGMADIDTLSHVNRLGYCNFYGLDQTGTPIDVKRRIAAAIGVAS